MREPIPWPLSVLGALGAALVLVPLVGLVIESPWGDLPSLVTSEVVLDALALSMFSATAAAVLSVLLGVPLAWLLARGAFRGRSVLRAAVTLPMVLPPVVGGAALLVALGRRGVVGEPLDEATGIVLPFSIWGVILANTFVAMPFLVITVAGALGSIDRRYEAAARTLGASSLSVFTRVTLPMIRPALVAGFVLAWARALGEFGATVTFAGNLPGRTQTLPLAVFVALESDRDAAIAMSLVLVTVSLVVLVSLRDRWWGSR
ncbi:MAG: ABC transporter permease [Actinomycetota bacterium]